MREKKILVYLQGRAPNTQVIKCWVCVAEYESVCGEWCDMLYKIEINKTFTTRYFKIFQTQTTSTTKEKISEYKNAFKKTIKNRSTKKNRHSFLISMRNTRNTKKQKKMTECLS